MHLTNAKLKLVEFGLFKVLEVLGKYLGHVSREVLHNCLFLLPWKICPLAT